MIFLDKYLVPFFLIHIIETTHLFYSLQNTKQGHKKLHRRLKYKHPSLQQNLNQFSFFSLEIIKTLHREKAEMLSKIVSV